MIHVLRCSTEVDVSGRLHDRGEWVPQHHPVLQDVVGLDCRAVVLVASVEALADYGAALIKGPLKGLIVVRVGRVQRAIRCVAVRLARLCVFDNGVCEAGMVARRRVRLVLPIKDEICQDKRAFLEHGDFDAAACEPAVMRIVRAANGLRIGEIGKPAGIVEKRYTYLIRVGIFQLSGLRYGHGRVDRRALRASALNFSAKISEYLGDFVFAFRNLLVRFLFARCRTISRLIHWFVMSNTCSVQMRPNNNIDSVFVVFVLDMIMQVLMKAAKFRQAPTPEATDFGVAVNALPVVVEGELLGLIALNKLDELDVLCILLGVLARSQLPGVVFTYLDSGNFLNPNAVRDRPGQFVELKRNYNELGEPIVFCPQKLIDN